jgi:putative Mg2+ transporter-C (MgtC) family protein
LNGASDLAIELTTLLRLLIAGVCGSVVGLQSELRQRPGGLRTHALTAMGAALFVITSLQLTDNRQEAIRVIQGVASGVGFIGAATVITRSGSVRGVATAASIWIAAAIGCSVATGQWATAVASALLATAVNAIALQLQKRFAAGTGEGL